MCSKLFISFRANCGKDFSFFRAAAAAENGDQANISRPIVSLPLFLYFSCSTFTKCLFFSCSPSFLYLFVSLSVWLSLSLSLSLSTSLFFYLLNSCLIVLFPLSLSLYVMLCAPCTFSFLCPSSSLSSVSSLSCSFPYFISTHTQHKKLIDNRVIIQIEITGSADAWINTLIIFILHYSQARVWTLQFD